MFVCKQKTAYEMRISDWSSDVCSSDLRSHGGIVASCVDETLGGLLPVIGEMAFTGELSLRYEGPCPMGVPLEFRAWLDRREGRKLHLHCTGSADGAVFVRATALFITVDLERFRANG